MDEYWLTFSLGLIRSKLSVKTRSYGRKRAANSQCYLSGWKKIHVRFLFDLFVFPWDNLFCCRCASKIKPAVLTN